MQTELERPSQFRVLMRIPRLRRDASESVAAEASPEPAVEVQTTELEFEVSEIARQVAEDIAVVQGGRRWTRPAVLVPALLAVVAVAFALLSRDRGAPPADVPHDVSLDVPLVTLPTESTTVPAAAAIPGGSPSEVTSAPELALPAVGTTSGDPFATIERLPPVPPENVATAPWQENVSSVEPTPLSGAAADRTVRLDNSIVTPKPDAQHDSSQPGLY